MLQRLLAPDGIPPDQQRRIVVVRVFALGSTMVAPQRSVRYVSVPALRSVASVVAAGCPNKLCRPTLMRA